MFLTAAVEHEGLNLEQSVVFGDSAHDMAAGAQLGMLRVLVGPESTSSRADVAVADHRAPTLQAAVRWFLGRDLDAARRIYSPTATTS